MLLRRAWFAAAAAPLLLVLVGCSGGSADNDLTVLAAASLTDAFTEIGAALEAEHPGVDVRFDFGPSSALAASILEGAPADVFASADPTNMDDVVDAERVRGTARAFARNLLELAVPEGNPGEVTGVADLEDRGLLIGLCAPEVPCGRLARELLASLGVTPSLDTEEADVRALLTKLGAGELDAGIVYRTDVRAAAGDVEGIAVPEAARFPAVYTIAALRGAASAADTFLDFVLSAEGQRILERHGFGPR